MAAHEDERHVGVEIQEPCEQKQDDDSAHGNPCGRTVCGSGNSWRDRYIFVRWTSPDPRKRKPLTPQPSIPLQMLCLIFSFLNLLSFVFSWLLIEHTSCQTKVDGSYCLILLDYMKTDGFTKKKFQLSSLKSGSEIFGKNTRLDRYYPSGTNSPNYFNGFTTDNR